MRAKLLSITLFAATLAAQSGPPPIPVELRARFGFTGPRIHKIGEGIDNLQLLDLDGNGRRAIVVRDGRRARLLALRVPGGELTSESIPTDGQNAGYTAADVDGDRRAELLLVDSSGRLHVRSGGKDLQPPFDLGLGGRGVGLLTGDLDGDGKPDLVAFSRDGLRWLTHLGGTPVASPIEPVEENAHSYLLEDGDGDGKLDLVAVVPGNRMSLRLRRGGGDGTFGAWLLLPIEGLHHVLLTAYAKAPALATIEGATRRVGLYRYVSDGGRGALQWWPFGGAAAKTSVPFVLCDLDGDGEPELVVAQPERARLLLFRWQNGAFVSSSVPTLAGLTCLAAGDIDGDGKQDLVLVSPEEDALAWKSGALPLETFPQRLPCSDKPLAAVVAPDGMVAAITRNDKREAHLGTCKPGGSWSNLIDLGRLPADPVRLLAADVGDAAGIEYAFVVPGEGLRIVNATAGGSDAAGKTAKAADVAGFTRKIEDGALALAQHGEQAALLVVRERFLRTFRSDRDGQLQVLAQDNGPEGASELNLAAALPRGGRLYLDKKGGKLYRKDGDGQVLSVDVPQYDFSYLLAYRDSALLLGPRGLLRVPFGPGPALAAIAACEPPTDKSHYWHGRAGDFDGDGAPDLAILDGQLHGVQILTMQGNALVRALAMPVFETNAADQSEAEPRELAVGDVDGDGRCDLVLLVHDRVLIYLQEK